MIVLNSPKGWTGPKMVDGSKLKALSVRTRCRSPILPPIPNTLSCWKTGSKVTGRRNSSTQQGRLKPELAELAPQGRSTHGRQSARQRRHSAARSPHARFPRLCGRCALARSGRHGDTHVLGRFLRDVDKLNHDQRNFRVFGPDETLSNGLEALFEVDQTAMGSRNAPE